MDGWITIGTKLDNSKFDRQMSDLESRIQSEEKKQDLLNQKIVQQQAELAKATQNVEKLEQEYTKATAKAQELTNTIARMKASGAGAKILGPQMELESQQRKIQQIAEELEKAKDKQLGLTARVEQTKLSYENSQRSVARIKGKIQEASVKANQLQFKNANKSANELNKGLDNVKSGISSAIHKIGKMALAVLSIRSAYMLVRQASSTLGQYDKQYAADLEYIRFVIAQGIAPVLRKVVELAQTLLAYVNYLVQRLFGVNLFANASAKAFKSAKDSMSGMAKSSKEIKNNLAAFDEINVLNQDNGAGTGDSALLPSMDIGGLEDVEIPEWLKKLADLLEPITSIFKNWETTLDGVKKVFEGMTPYAKEFEKGLKEGIGGANTKELEEDIKSIGATLKRIFTDPEVQIAAEKAAKKISKALGQITGSASRIGINFATLAVGSAESYMTENEDRIKDHTVKMFDITGRGAEIAGNFSVALADISDVFSSQEAQDIGGDIIAIFTNPFMSIQELAGNFGVDVLDLITKPFIDNKDKIKTTITNMFEPIKKVTETVKTAVTEMGDKINEVYDQHIHPFIESLRDGISDTFGKFLDMWNTHAKPVLDNLATKFTEVWEQHMKPMFEKWGEFMGKIMNLLTVLYEQKIKPFVDWVVQNILPVLMPIIEGLGNAIGTFFGAIFDYVGRIFDALGGLIDFITGVFTGDWELAWQGIVDFFEGIFGGITDFVKGTVNIVIDLINGMIAAIEKALNMIREKINSIEITNPFTGEEIWSPNIPKFDFGRIPHLAKGGIVAQPTHAIIGESGREAVMPLENNTEWMDELANKINAGGNITIRFTGSTAQLVRLLKPELEKEDKRTGKRLIIGGAY